MRRTVLLAATMVITALFAVGIASADPLKSKNAQILTLDCGGEEVTVVTLFNNNAVVNNVVDTTANFVLTRFEGTATFTDPETGEVVEEEFAGTVGKGKKQGLQRSLTTCDTSFTFEDPEVGTVRLDLTADGFFTPRGGSDGDS
jgi:hypothetical protein